MTGLRSDELGAIVGVPPSDDAGEPAKLPCTHSRHAGNAMQHSADMNRLLSKCGPM